MRTIKNPCVRCKKESRLSGHKLGRKCYESILAAQRMSVRAQKTKARLRALGRTEEPVERASENGFVSIPRYALDLLLDAYGERLEVAPVIVRSKNGSSPTLLIEPGPRPRYFVERTT